MQKIIRNKKIKAAINVYIQLFHLKDEEQVNLVKANLLEQLKILQSNPPTEEWGQQLQIRCLLEIAKQCQQSKFKFDMSNLDEMVNNVVDTLKKTNEFLQHVIVEPFESECSENRINLVERDLFQLVDTIRKLFKKVSDLETRLILLVSKSLVVPKEQIHFDISEFLDVTLNPRDFVSYKEILYVVTKLGISSSKLNRHLTSLINRVNNPNMRRYRFDQVRGFIGLKLKKV